MHRADGSGTTNNFTKFLTLAQPTAWKLGNADSVNWPANTQGAQANSGVAALISQTDGAIGYVDLADALKAKLVFASVQNSAGNFMAPTAEATKAAVEGATVKPDLTYAPQNAPGEKAYPITAPTFLIVYAAQTDPAKSKTLKTYLQYVLTTGQKQAGNLGYVAIPDALATKAIAQIDKITG